MSQLREYIETHPSEAQRLVGLDYDKLMSLISQAEQRHQEKRLAVEEKKTRLIKAGGGRQALVKSDRPDSPNLSIPTSPADMTNVRSPVWGERISGQLYLSLLARYIKRAAASVSSRTSKKKRKRLGMD